MTVVSIHQPNYIPYLGFFEKMKRSDIFVLLDNVQFVRTGEFAWQHRQKIRTKIGEMWLTIPVKREFKIAINKVQVANQTWQKKHWRSIETNYSRSFFWDKYAMSLRKFYEKTYEKLVDVTVPMIKWLAEQLGIYSEIIIASELNLNEYLFSTDLLVEIIRKVDGDVYLSGPMGKNYLEETKFSGNGIGLTYLEFKHPIYKQVYPSFIKNMSVIDFMFNNNNKLYI